MNIVGLEISFLFLISLIFFEQGGNEMLLIFFQGFPLFYYKHHPTFCAHLGSH
jgi:hypothetical protein